MLVVLYHANVPLISGGYVGVDVFFVISGFVITGVLLRERAATSTTSILAFYGRRCRRIIPAATLVIVTTALLSYGLLGYVSGNNVAVDGRWAAVFLSNFHFQAVGTNYLSSFLPPSPLQNYWSLSIEEQFYAVFPMLFLLVARTRRLQASFEARLAVMLTLVIVGSFSLSVVQTAANSSGAYFSPFARAWELAIGALIATGTRWLISVPTRIAATATWMGIGAILFAAFTFDGQTDYPGWLVAIPVLGAGLIIAGGAAGPRFGTEVFLGRAPFRWLGKMSYSLYLWHWPILVLAAESAGQTSLPLPKSLFWVAIALVVSMATYALIENPIRHARLLNRNRWASIGLGVGLTVLTVAILSVQIHSHQDSVGSTEATPTSTEDSVPTSLAAVRRMVAAAGQIRTSPANLSPLPGAAFFDFGLPSTWTGCDAGEADTSVPACTFGDPHGTPILVLYGDSHAIMWAQAINDIAIRARWRFVLLAKPDCPVNMLPYKNPAGFGAPGGEWSACDGWHRNSLQRINRIDPRLLIVTQELHARPDGRNYTPTQWQHALEHVLNLVSSPGTAKVVLGNIPLLAESGPDCLARHGDDVQACSGPRDSWLTPYNRAERTAAESTGARYVDVSPWLCGDNCSAVIGHYEVYMDRFHITNTYARFLEGALAEALQLPDLQPLPPSVPDLRTSMLVPKTQSALSGTTILDATATDTVRVTTIEFHLKGGLMHDDVIGVGKQTLDGCIAGWDTRSVPNGTYQLRSVAYDTAGNRALSSPITVSIKN